MMHLIEEKNIWRKFNIIFCILGIIESINGIDYTGYKLYEAMPTNHSQYEILERIENLGFDYWDHVGSQKMKILVPPHLLDDFERITNNIGIPTNILTDDINSILEQGKNVTISRRRSLDTDNTKFNFDRFPRYEEIVEYVHELARRSTHGKIISIGRSFEGRPLIGLKIETSPENPVIFVDAGIHAREWAAPVTALYIMKRLVDLEHLVADKLSVYIFPCINPDGYEYSHTDERFWRKTRSVNPVSKCKGVDGNRNFNSYWAEVGASPNPCSGIFPGFAPFSEPETRAIRDAILRTKPTLYLTLHSYGPLLLYPWGFTHYLPENWKELDELGRVAISKLKKVNGQDYVIGSATNVLYPASGGSDDWAMQKAHVPLVYTMELPEYGKGFVVPVEKIKPMVKETFAAFQVFVRYVCAMHNERCL